MFIQSIFLHGKKIDWINIYTNSCILLTTTPMNADQISILEQPFEYIAVAFPHGLFNADCTLERKDKSSIAWRLLFNGNKHVFWIFRSSLLPSQDQFFADLTIGSQLQIKYSYFYSRNGKHKHYILVYYKLIQKKIPSNKSFFDELLDYIFKYKKLAEDEEPLIIN